MDGHLGQVSKARHQFHLRSKKTFPVYNTPYEAVSKSRQFSTNRNLEDAKERCHQAGNEGMSKSHNDSFRNRCLVPSFIYYRKLNAITSRNCRLSLRLDECFDWFGRVVIFLMLNANSGYWQMQVDPRNHGKIGSVITMVFSNSRGCHLATVMLHRVLESLGRCLFIRHTQACFRVHGQHRHDFGERRRPYVVALASFNSFMRRWCSI